MVAVVKLLLVAKFGKFLFFVWKISTISVCMRQFYNYRIIILNRTCFILARIVTWEFRLSKQKKSKLKELANEGQEKIGNERNESKEMKNKKLKRGLPFDLLGIRERSHFECKRTQKKKVEKKRGVLNLARFLWEPFDLQWRLFGRGLFEWRFSS